MSLLQNQIKILYRRLIKQNMNKTSLCFRNLVNDKESISYFDLKENLITNKTATNKEDNMIEFIEEYLTMRKFIKIENDLLISYNINVIRDNKTQIERTANYCGLSV